MLYDELLSGRSGDALLHTARASALVKAGRMGDAESALRRALELDPAAADAWYLVAVIELADGREIDAEEHLQRAVELKPDLAGAHLQLARLYHRRGDPRSAQHAELAVRASAPVGPRAPAEVKERVGDGIH